MQYKKYYWTEAAGFRLMGYADGRTYKTRDSAMTACLTNSRCRGITQEGNSRYRINTCYIPSTETSMTAYIKGGAAIDVQEFSLTYAGYTWTFKRPFTMEGYSDGRHYHTRDAALNACGAQRACVGVTKEAERRFRLNALGTVYPQKGRSVWIQGGEVATGGGFTWSSEKGKTLTGYVNIIVYKTLKAALEACGKSKGCVGVTREGESNYRLNSSGTKKISGTSISYLKSNALLIANDYFWTKVPGLMYKDNRSNRKYKSLDEASEACAKDVHCSGITASDNVFVLGRGTELRSKPDSSVYVQGSLHTETYYITHGGYVWRGTSPYMLGGMEGRVFKSEIVARDYVLKHKRRYRGYTRLEDGTFRLNNREYNYMSTLISKFSILNEIQIIDYDILSPKIARY